MMCVSKARLGDLICTLPASDMRAIDEAIAKTVDLRGYYSNISKRLDDKLNFISKIKEERNKAQDELKELRQMLELSENESLFDCIANMKKSIDNLGENM